MIGESLVRGLRDEGYAVDWVRDGAAAMAALQDSQAEYSLAVLDWNLAAPGRPFGVEGRACFRLRVAHSDDYRA